MACEPFHFSTGRRTACVFDLLVKERAGGSIHRISRVLFSTLLTNRFGRGLTREYARDMPVAHAFAA